MPEGTPYLERGEHRVRGVLAEIVSVLEQSALWKDSLGLGSGEILVTVRALDTTRPAEERVVEAANLCKTLKAKGRLSRWIPWFDKLSDYEYSNQFYPGYRDHTIHSLQVFLLGMYLYETVHSIREPLDQYLGDSITTVELAPSDLFLEWWLLTALWHDWGYPFESTEFLTNKEKQEEVLSAFSDKLGKDPFLKTLEGTLLTSREKREFYKLGSYYPLSLNSVADIIGDAKAQDVIDNMWKRLGLCLDDGSLLSRIDVLTTQTPVGRPPYHDHGLVGAAHLALWAREVESFLTDLVDNLYRSSFDPRKVQLFEDGWETFINLAPLVTNAVEAIAFHNVSFSQLSAHGASASFIPAGFRTKVPLAEEPHLFFLALSDTLQDWDRHHFVPASTFTQYRPQVNATEMLLQGDGDRIRVLLVGDRNPIETMRGLFNGWLNEEDIGHLFSSDPRFSLPDKIMLAVGAELSHLQRSARERDRLCHLIDEKTKGARSTLIAGKPDSVTKASSMLEFVMKQVRDSRASLTFSDRAAVKTRLEERGLNQLRAQSWTLIGEGSRLSLGSIERKIGYGGFGTVYQIAGAGNQLYAFKLYHQHDLHNTEKLRLFRRGYDAMAALNDHDNVVSVLSFSEVPLGFYMEFIPGTNLEQGLELLGTVHDRLSTAVKVGETVARAHELGILHRDIKPANVILDSREYLNPVLTDFDLAWIETKHTQHTEALYANMHYGAPEQFEPRLLDFRQRQTVDVYSLGALIYYLLLSQAPPHWKSWSESHWKVFEERLQGQVDAPVVMDLRELLGEMLTVDPEERIGSVGKAVSRLSRIHSRTLTGDERLARQDWEKQVAYEATGSLEITDGRFFSKAGGVQWHLHTRLGRMREFSCSVELGLITEPHFEGVDYNTFRQKAARRIDERLGKFEGEWDQVKTRRTGFPTENSKARIQFIDLPCTLESARSVGRLISQINRAIE